MWSDEKNKKVTISMKKYIKPDTEIIHAAPAHLMGISKTELSTNTSVITNSNKESDTDISIIGGDEVVDDGGDLEAAKRNWSCWDEE